MSLAVHLRRGGEVLRPARVVGAPEDCEAEVAVATRGRMPRGSASASAGGSGFTALALNRRMRRDVADRCRRGPRTWVDGET